jgi:hypothetical protein
VTITARDFARQLAPTRLDALQDRAAKLGTKLSAAELEALGRADLDGDGVLGGSAEARAAWRALDDFDVNGDRRSVDADTGRGHVLARVLGVEDGGPGPARGRASSRSTDRPTDRATRSTDRATDRATNTEPWARPPSRPGAGPATDAARGEAWEAARRARDPVEARPLRPEGVEGPPRASSSPRAPAAARRASATGPAAAPIHPSGRADPEARRALVEEVRARVPAADRAAYERVSEVNARTESGGRDRWSGLATTAGRPASYGRGQLVIREHLSEADRLSDAQLGRLRVTRGELDAARARGSAAEGWYRAMHDGRRGPASARRLGLSPAERTELRGLVEGRRWDEAEARFGARFTESTGLPASELRAMGQTAVLRDPAHRAEFRRLYREQHGVDFDPRRRDNDRMAATARRLAESRPELAEAAERLGGSYSSLGYYLGRGDTAENLNGWYARAAEGALGRERFVGLVESVNDVSTEARHVRNFMRARAALADSGLSGEARTRMLARLSRQFHGAPGAALDTFFHGRDLSRPRAHSPAEAERLLQRLLSNDRRRQSDENLLRRYD